MLSAASLVMTVSAWFLGGFVVVSGGGNSRMSRGRGSGGGGWMVRQQDIAWRGVAWLRLISGGGSVLCRCSVA